MKILFVLSLFVGVSFASSDLEFCYDDVVNACNPTGSKSSISCNSVYGGFEHVLSDLQSYANDQLATSYDYMMLGSYFNTYMKNRPGLSKLIQHLSDRAFEHGIKLIEYISKRGGAMNLQQRNEDPSTITVPKRKLEVDELNALSILLDSEKRLAMEAHKIHLRTSHLGNEKHYDPEVSQFLEEKFIEEQAEIIRKLSGYTNDLAKFAKKDDPSLGIYLFDEYIGKDEL